MQRLNKSITHAVDRPVKVMQFGEGNFLRAVSYTHLRDQETRHDLECRILLEK